MTPAECKCLRESMGLSTKWLAARWNVAESSVKRWERNRVAPDAISNDLRSLKESFTRQVIETINQASRRDMIKVPRVNEPRDAMPASWYRAIAQRAAEQTGVSIIYTDDEFEDAEI